MTKRNLSKRGPSVAKTKAAKRTSAAKADLARAAEFAGRAAGRNPAPKAANKPVRIGGLKAPRVMSRQETGELLGRRVADDLIRSSGIVAERIATAQIDGDHDLVQTLAELNACLWRMRWELGLHPENDSATAAQGRALATVQEYDPASSGGAS
jgi:hypothetical protein